MDFEVAIIEFLQSGRTAGLDTFFLTVTQLGSTLGFIAFFLFLLIFDRKLCLTFSLSYGYELLFVRLVKACVARVRPYDAFSSIVCIGGYESEFSFPSGHTALAVTIAIFMAYFLWKRYRGTFARCMIVLCTSAYAVLIGVSRMYLGVHYLTDLLGGAAFAIVFSAIGICAMVWLDKVRKKQKERQNESKD